MIARFTLDDDSVDFTHGVGTRERKYVKYTKGTWVLERVMREWREEIVFCLVTLR